MVDQSAAAPEKITAHQLTPVSCGPGECSTQVVFPMAFIGVVLAVVVTIAWNVGRRLLRRRRRGPSSIG